MSLKLNQLCFAVVAASIFSVAYAEDDVAATPYRPTAASPAGLSVPGWLELEFGGQQAKGGSDNWRQGYPVMAKLALNDRWAVLLGSELAVQRTDLSGQVFRGNGDTLIVLKRYIPTATEGNAFGIELGHKQPTASADIGGSGQPDTTLNGIFSTSVAGNTVDMNLGVSSVGGVAEGVDIYQYTWAVAASRSLSDRWGVFAAVNGSAQTGLTTKTQLMAGMNHTLNKRVVFDAGVARGMTADAPELIVFAGVTVLAARLW